MRNHAFAKSHFFITNANRSIHRTLPYSKGGPIFSAASFELMTGITSKSTRHSSSQSIDLRKRDLPFPLNWLQRSSLSVTQLDTHKSPAGDPDQIARSVEAAIHDVDPDQAVSDIKTMEAVFSDSVSSPRFQAILLLVFAGLAVTLAMIGVYGVVSYSVSERTHEIGIRVALGAASRDVVRLVLQEANAGRPIVALRYE